MNPIDQLIENDIDASIELRRDAELPEGWIIVAPEKPEDEEVVNDVPYCCEECEGQEMLFATQRTVR